MTWLQRYRLRHFLAFSFWLVPVLWMVAAIVAVRGVRAIDVRTGLTLFELSPDGARGMLGGLSSSLLTFIAFAVSALLLAVQMASGQLTPRVIAFAFARKAVKWSVGVFVFTYTFTLAALGRVEDDHVPQLTVAVAAVSTLISIGLFFWFVQHVGTSLRPVAILQALWISGRRVIDQVYTEPFGADAALAPEDGAWRRTARVIEHTGSSGTLLAFGIGDLVAAAARAGAAIELIPQVGDFVSRGDALFRVHPPTAAVDEDALQAMIAVGPERTLEQDPAFAFRIMADIAARALSPAINDPTTAVLALDQLHRLLRHVGQRRLGAAVVLDASGAVRLRYARPEWDDFVTLAVTEIRLFGAESIQVPRRLRAMIEQLIAVLPAPRAEPLRAELALLERAVDRLYVEPEDRRRADTSDRQGLGGARADAAKPHPTARP